MRKAKLSLIATIAVGLLAISTAGVSTWAWFQTNASATVTAESTSTTITTAKPDEYAFYAYKGNRDSSHSLTNTFSTDFTLITSSNLAAETSLTGIKPGDIKTYCIVISGHDTSKNVSLNITKITSNDAYMESSGVKHRYIHGGSVEINIGWAINIYSTAATSNASSGYSTFVTSATGTDKFNYYNNNRSTLLAGTSDGNAINLSTPISIYNDAVANSTVYLYYSVVFTNVNSTLYKEVDSSGNSLFVPSTDNTRRFMLYNDSDSAFEKTRYNSNCYQGLTFALNTLSLAF